MRKLTPTSAAAPILLSMSLLATGCGTLTGSSDADRGIIGSEVVALSPEGSGEGAEGLETEGDDPAQEAESDDPAEDSSAATGETPTELSTDPNIVYPPDTCYEPPAPGEISEKVDCADPHTVEVYAVRDLPGDDGAPFQDLDAAIALCNEDFLRITGVGIGLATVFRRSVLRPSEETWLEGERDVTCFVVYPEPVDLRLSEVNPVRAFGRVSLYGMEVGDCFPDFDEQATTFEAVPCDQPHNAEVFIDEELPPGPYPGDESIEARADELCFGQPFTDFVGVDYTSSTVFSLRSRPSEETWAEGDRSINCILTDETTRAGSFQGSAE